ncbi:uncharacterized protein [Gossypium hirsutum]|uniref:Reverse transcriptase RNase H-like domain-containing protein n=1 Tax=Gossypium hirsutum TaxID=3635 RepID=A0A1U8JMU3_GOSHI|nr:uncharacterized protein LOC107908827 [Gossypium hirsutum]
MPSLETNIMEHEIPLKSDSKPIYQKLRRMKPEMLLKIKEELTDKCDPIFKLLRKDSDGCVLGKRDGSNKKEHAIYYLSKKFTKYEAKYSHLEKMCCILAWTMRQLRQYILYHTTFLIAKLDPLKYIFEKPSLSGRFAHSQVVLSEYDIVYVSQKVIKESIVAQFPADRMKEEYKLMSFDFPDEEIMSISKCEEEIWRVYFDKASNMMGHRIGVVLISPSGQYFPATAKLMFTCTNNVAKYEACILTL